MVAGYDIMDALSVIGADAGLLMGSRLDLKIPEEGTFPVTNLCASVPQQDRFLVDYLNAGIQNGCLIDAPADLMREYMGRVRFLTTMPLRICENVMNGRRLGRRRGTTPRPRFVYAHTVGCWLVVFAEAVDAEDPEDVEADNVRIAETFLTVLNHNYENAFNKAAKKTPRERDEFVKNQLLRYTQQVAALKLELEGVKRELEQRKEAAEGRKAEATALAELNEIAFRGIQKAVSAIAESQPTQGKGEGK